MEFRPGYRPNTVSYCIAERWYSTQQVGSHTNYVSIIDDTQKEACIDIPVSYDITLIQAYMQLPPVLGRFSTLEASQ